MFVLLAGDIALIVDQEGVIQNMAVGTNFPDASPRTWIGSRWADTVTGDTRRKIELLMQEVHGTAVTRRREVNHRASDGAGIPMSYAALRLGKQGPVLAVGRDLRTVAAIQQRMIRAQEEMERNYWTLRRDQDQRREMEQVASDAVLVAGRDLIVRKFNEAAGDVLMQVDGTLCEQIKGLLIQAQQSGKTVEVRTRVKSKGPQSPLLDLFFTPMHANERDFAGQSYLVRARQVVRTERLPSDICTVITDTQGRILMASDAVIAMSCESDPQNLYGKPIEKVLDNADGLFAGLLLLVLREGMAHAASATIGGNVGPAYEIDATATLIVEGDKERVGFCLQVRQADTGEVWSQTLESIVASQSALITKLQDVQDLTERRVIGDALRKTRANLSASANLLGVSVQDLMQRLDRLGLDHAQYTAH